MTISPTTRLTLPLILVLLSSDPLAAQMRVIGTVTDDLGAPVPGALVRMAGRETITDAIGRFAFDDVAAGEYEVEVEVASFDRASQVVRVSPNESSTADFILSSFLPLRQYDQVPIDDLPGVIPGSWIRPIGICRGGEGSDGDTVFWIVEGFDPDSVLVEMDFRPEEAARPDDLVGGVRDNVADAEVRCLCRGVQRSSLVGNYWPYDEGGDGAGWLSVTDHDRLPNSCVSGAEHPR